MAKIYLTRTHQLDQQSVRDRVQELANKLETKLSAEYQWQKDRLVFKRSGANGFIKISNQELEIEVQLGMLLRPLKASIEKTIMEYLDEHLT